MTVPLRLNDTDMILSEVIKRFELLHQESVIVEGSDCGDSDEEQMAREQAENDEMNDQAQFEAEQNAQGQAEADNAQHEGEW